MSEATPQPAAISADALAKASDIANNIRSAVGKAVIGQREVIDQVVIALFAAGHVLIEGVPALAKPCWRALAKTFSGEFARIQFRQT